MATDAPRPARRCTIAWPRLAPAPPVTTARLPRRSRSSLTGFATASREGSRSGRRTSRTVRVNVALASSIDLVQGSGVVVQYPPQGRLREAAQVLGNELSRCHHAACRSGVHARRVRKIRLIEDVVIP